MNWKNYPAKFWEPANGTGLDLFRKCLAVLLIIQIGGFYSADIVNKTFILNRIRIPFECAAWLPNLHGKMMHLPFLLQFIGCLLLFTDRYARRGALLYLLSFGYVFLIEISYYNNHYYFILLLCLFYCFYKPVKINGVSTVPRVLLYLFQFQVIIVYFYGGVAKLNADWLLRQEPMREMLQLTNSHHWPESMVMFYTYGGLIFDLLIGFLLLMPKTLKVAVIMNIIFHLSNIFMFSSGGNATIGVFPFLMIATNLLFIKPDQLQGFLNERLPGYFTTKNSATKRIKWEDVYAMTPKKKSIFHLLIFSFVCFQILMPLRHFLIPGNVDWTSEGYYFSWRLKVRSKTANNIIKVKNPMTGKIEKVNPFRFLNTLQYKAVCDDPAAMYAFIQQLKKEAKAVGMPTEFYVNWTCVMNGHARQAVVDSTIDFSLLRHKLIGGDPWILPFK